MREEGAARVPEGTLEEGAGIGGEVATLPYRDAGGGGVVVGVGGSVVSSSLSLLLLSLLRFVSSLRIPHLKHLQLVRYRSYSDPPPRPAHGRCRNGFGRGLLPAVDGGVGRVADEGEEGVGEGGGGGEEGEGAAGGEEEG